MKFQKLILGLGIIFVSFTQAQAHQSKEHKLINELNHLEINKVVYYETPYFTDYHKPLEVFFKPDWYWGYCATFYPQAFNDYVNDAKKYISPDGLYSTAELKSYKDNFDRQYSLKSGDLFNKPHSYFFADVYFTHVVTNKKYLMTLSYDVKKLLLENDLSKMDTTKYKIAESLYEAGQISQSDINYSLNSVPTTIIYYVLEDNEYKSADNVEVLQNVIRNGDSNLYVDVAQFDDFYKLLKSCPDYIRSRIVSGDRIFEKVKYVGDNITVLENLSSLGCLKDSDNDGVDDCVDRCPNEAGPALGEPGFNNGCPYEVQNPGGHGNVGPRGGWGN